MSLRGCFSCCQSDPDEGRCCGKEWRTKFLSRVFESAKPPGERNGLAQKRELSKEELLWTNVLGELEMKHKVLHDPDDDLTAERSMAWIFKVLKPAQSPKGSCGKRQSITSSVLCDNIGSVTEAPDPHTNSEDVDKLSLEDMSNVVPPIGKLAPQFKGVAVINGEFKEISLAQYKGKYVVFFFYPLDFTFVCPTEIIAFSERVKEFRSIGCEIIACSTDSHFSHLAWVNTERKEGGLGSMDIPILADKSMDVAKAYGVLKESDGVAFRGLFIIDDKQILRQVTINDLPVGRDVDETLRLVQAFQFTDKHGEVCPAGWKPGQKTMKADPKGSKDYFKTENYSEFYNQLEHLKEKWSLADESWEMLDNVVRNFKVDPNSDELADLQKRLIDREPKNQILKQITVIAFEAEIKALFSLCKKLSVKEEGTDVVGLWDVDSIQDQLDDDVHKKILDTLHELSRQMDDMCRRLDDLSRKLDDSEETLAKFINQKCATLLASINVIQNFLTGTTTAPPSSIPQG